MLQGTVGPVYVLTSPVSAHRWALPHPELRSVLGSPWSPLCLLLDFFRAQPKFFPALDL